MHPNPQKKNRERKKIHNVMNSSTTNDFCDYVSGAWCVPTCERDEERLKLILQLASSINVSVVDIDEV